MNEKKQLPRKHVRSAYKKCAIITSDELGTNTIPAKRKRRRLTKLSIKEMKKVLKAVKVDYLTHESAAIKYNISTTAVGKIVRNFKHKSDYEGELLEKQAKKEEKLAAAIKTI